MEMFIGVVIDLQGSTGVDWDSGHLGVFVASSCFRLCTQFVEGPSSYDFGISSTHPGEVDICESHGRKVLERSPLSPPTSERTSSFVGPQYGLRGADETSIQAFGIFFSSSVSKNCMPGGCNMRKESM